MYQYNQLIFPSHMEKNKRFMVIAGFSLNGPVQAPFIIREGVDPKSVLGESKMTDNYIVAKQHGITPLLFRINGSHGEATLMHDTKQLPVLQFRTLEAHDECNQIDIRVFETHLVIQGLNSSYLYYFSDYNNIDELSIAIKKDLYFGSGELDVDVLNNTTLTGLCLKERDIHINGADDGYNYMNFYDEIYSDEKIAEQVALIKESMIVEEDEGIMSGGELSNFIIDTLVFTDIPYEVMPIELLQALGSFAKTKTDDQLSFCSVVIGSELFSDSRYDEYNNDLYSEQVQLLQDKSPYSLSLGDSSKHIEVVIGTRDSVNSKNITMPCASTYASMRYTLSDYHLAATNKPLSVNALYNRELKKDEVANLTSNGYICIVPSIQNGFVPFSSKSIYPLTSIQSKPHYLRSIYSDVKTITNIFDQYIGQPFSSTLLQNTLTQIGLIGEQLVGARPIYKNMRIEVTDSSTQSVSLLIMFELYGEVEAVRTSLQYTSVGGVSVTW